MWKVLEDGGSECPILTLLLKKALAQLRKPPFFSGNVSEN